MKLNNENIDELMFQLLEGEIRGEERAKLLDAINADKEYSLQWQAWQQTILNPNSEMLVMNTGKLLKKDKKAMVLWWKYCAAAVVVLAAGLSVYFMNSPKIEDVAGAVKPGNPKTQIIKVPSVDPVNQPLKVVDSVVPFRQKVQMMVGKDKKGINIKEAPVKERHQEKNNPETEIQNTPEETIAQTPLPVIINQTQKKEIPVISPSRTNEGNGVIMTVYTENQTVKTTPAINNKIQEKRNLLSRILSTPKLKIVNDSNTYTNKKIILENKEYKIIAGF